MSLHASRKTAIGKEHSLGTPIIDGIPGERPSRAATKKEMTSFGPYIGGCGPHANFIPQGACSDQNTPEENEAIRNGKKPGSGKKRRKIKSESFAEFVANRESEQRG